MDEKYNIGQNVVIAEALGDRVKGKYKEYYFGGYTSNVPLGSKGKIENIDSGRFFIRLNNGEQWWVTPQEIRVETDISPRIKSLLKTPRHPVFELSENNSVFVVGNKVYLGENFEIRNRLPTKRNIDFKEIGEIKTLDELALSRDEDNIEEAKKEYSDSVIEGLGLHQLSGKNSIPALICNEVFPYLRESGYNDKISRLFKQKKSNPIRRGRRNSELDKIIMDSVSRNMKIIQKSIREMEREDREEREGRNNSSRFLRALQENNLGVGLVNGFAYWLNKTSEEGLRIGNYNLEMEEFATLREAEDMYFKELYKEIRISALNDITESRVKSILEKRLVGFKNIAKIDNYENRDFGFLKYQRDYYVYIKVPKFAVKCRNSECFVFKDSKIGIKVNQNLSYSSYVYMIGGTNGHPITEGYDDEVFALCMGGNELPFSGKNNGEVIAKRLRKVRDIMLYGYSSEYYHEYAMDYLDDSYKKREDELRKKGIRIIELRG